MAGFVRPPSFKRISKWSDPLWRYINFDSTSRVTKTSVFPAS